MPTETACPVPGVDRALSSYINSRDDTLNIRRTLTRYVTSSLRPVNHATQQQHVNHECPQGISAANTIPPGLKGTRIAYLHALRTKSQAEARHRELQASLEELNLRHVDENPTLPQSEMDDEATRCYISLLRQRRKLTELNVIQESLDKLLCAKPSKKQHVPREQVAHAIGEQPDLPAEKLEQIAQPENNQGAIFKLKQEVLEARNRMDKANTVRQQAVNAGQDQLGLQKQVYALEKARNEIVEWMQGELAKMEEDSVFIEDASPIKRPNQADPALDLGSAEARIRSSYDRYTSARVELLRTYQSLTEPMVDKEHVGTTDVTQNVNGPSIDNKLVRPISKLLPHFPHFTRAAQNERSLLQQVVYLEGQFAFSEKDLEEALLRLSGESHLLPAGSNKASVWGRVAKEAEHGTELAVKEHLRESRHEINSIDAIADLCSLQSKVLASA